MEKYVPQETFIKYKEASDLDVINKKDLNVIGNCFKEYYNKWEEDIVEKTYIKNWQKICKFKASSIKEMSNMFAFNFIFYNSMEEAIDMQKLNSLISNYNREVEGE